MPDPTLVLTGAALGLASGLSPGPLMALVLAQTLAHGPREGVKVAAAPLLTDAPIILLALGIAGAAAGHGAVLGSVTLAGCLFLLHCALGCLRWSPAAQGSAPGGSPGSVRKGVLANLLNPAPYLFWTTVGAPLLTRAWQSGWGSVAAFLGAFSLSLVGSKAAIALLAGRFGGLLGSRGYLWLMRGLGLMLLGYAALFARDGWALLRAGLAGAVTGA